MKPSHTNLLLALPLVACAAPAVEHDEGLAAWERIRDAERAAAPPPSEPLDETSELDDLLRHARAHDPGLAAAFERWRAALERLPQTSTLPAPRMTLGAYLSPVETRVGPLRGRLGVSQPIPWPGKLELAGQAAHREAEAAREQLDAVRLDLDQRVRDTWYELAWLEQSTRITEGHRELLLHWESVALARLETGQVSHSDVIRAQVELGKLEDRVRTLRDLRRPLVARMNAALNRPADAHLPRPGYPLPAPPVFDEAQLKAQLAESSPVLRAMDQRIRAAELQVELAGKAFYPDVAVGAELGLIGGARGGGVAGSGDDTLALTLGLELPVRRDVYRAGVREAEARGRALTKTRDATRNRLSAELEMALYRMRDAHRRAELFQGSLIPKGEESVRALDTAYQTGEETFLDLIDAERVLLEFQLEAAKAESERAQALAEIQRITGADLFDTEPQS
jgi:outer membrane protein TolC